MQNRNTSEEMSSFSCPFCSKGFNKKMSVRSHILNIHGTDRGPFSCNVCGRLLKNKNSLNAHMYDYHKRRRKSVLETMSTQSAEPQSGTDPNSATAATSASVKNP